jgi:hypothetical protein
LTNVLHKCLGGPLGRRRNIVGQLRRCARLHEIDTQDARDRPRCVQRASWTKSSERRTWPTCPSRPGARIPRALPAETSAIGTRLCRALSAPRELLVVRRITVEPRHEARQEAVE